MLAELNGTCSNKRYVIYEGWVSLWLLSKDELGDKSIVTAKLELFILPRGNTPFSLKYGPEIVNSDTF